MELLVRLILLLLMISLSDAEEEKKNLTGTKGGNIILPDPVLEKGFLLYGGNVIAQVINRELSIEKNIHNNRLHWNKTSGLFTLTNLQKNDSGSYKIDSKKEEVSTLSIYDLTVYTIRLSDGEEEKKNLNGTKGGNIILPDPLLEKGFLLHGGKNIALVNDGKLKILENIYENRLHWNNSGLFTLTNLQKNDSGIYNIDSKQGNIFFKFYNLTVYDSVAPPAVQRLSVSSDSCYLLCAVDKAAEITLWWFKDEEVVNQSSSAGSLPLTVTKQDFNFSYRCVAGNPAEEKTLLVNLEEVCGQNFITSSSEDDERHHWIIIGVVAGFAGFAILIVSAALIWWKRSKRNEWTTTERQDPEGTKSDVEYTEVTFPSDRHSQGGTLPDPPEPGNRSDLTTVYDQLEAHRMVLPDSDGDI